MIKIKLNTLIFPLFLTLNFISSQVFAIGPVKQLNAVIVTPFSYENTKNIADNIENEIDVENRVPLFLFEHLKKLKPFKSVEISSNPQEEQFDIYIKGKVVDVKGGNGAARYFSLGMGGRAGLVIELEVYNNKNELLHKGFAMQDGGAGGNLFSLFSNKKNINKAIVAVAKKLYPIAVAGDLTTVYGIEKAIESQDVYTIRYAAISAIKNEIYKELAATDAIETVVQQAISSENDDGTYLDAVSWCLKVLGESKNVKYKSVITALLESKPSRKVKGYAKKALKKIKKANKA
jgi:hypothetical protein